MSNRYDINITVGESFLVYTGITTGNNIIFNLSGYSVRGGAKAFYSDTGNYYFNLNPNPILPYESGIIGFSGNSTGTQGLISNQFFYDIEIYNNSGYALKVINGNFNVTASTAFID